MKKLIYLSSNIFCTFNAFFTVNTLREGDSDSSIKQGTQESSSISPANPEQNFLVRQIQLQTLISDCCRKTFTQFLVWNMWNYFQGYGKNFYLWRIYLERKTIVKRNWHTEFLAKLDVHLFYKKRFFLTRTQCRLTFSWIELQMLFRCSLIHITILYWDNIYLVYLCACLRSGLFMSYLPDLFFLFSAPFSLSLTLII